MLSLYLIRIVIDIDKERLPPRWQTLGADGKAMVLGGDEGLTVQQASHRLVVTSVGTCKLHYI